MSPDTFDNVQTAIFRFRDLATSEGGTIRNHSELADTHGHVWWGWWNKPGESVPTSALRALLAKNSEALVPIYLFDSGRFKLYSVQCDNFTWDNSLKKMHSPDKEKTPAYYSEKDCLMWLKLRKGFRELDEAETVAVFKSHSYRRVDEVFENGKSRYDGFYDKRVFGFQELKQQDRTVWFVQTWRDCHATNEVVLTAANRLSPEHFSSSYIESKFRSLLWVSDLHCGDHYAFAEEPGDSSRQLLSVAVQGALESPTVEHPELAGVLVSGDLTWQATPREFERARKAITSLMRTQEGSGDFYRYLVCPGNHDLRFSSAPAEKGAPVNVAPAEAKKAYSDFYTDLFFLQPNEHLCSGRKFLLGGCIPVEIAAINTSLLEQKPQLFQGHGFVGHEQLECVAKGFTWQVRRGHPRPYRILMMHHHLVPTEYVLPAHENASYSTVLDTGPLMRFIAKYEIDLVLHGHMHEHFLSVQGRLREDGETFHTFYVAGLGSTGLKKGEHQTNENMVGLLTFSDMRFPTLTILGFGPNRETPKIILKKKLIPPSLTGRAPLDII